MLLFFSSDFFFSISSIFLGPLLWHFENTANEISIELSLEEVLALVEKLGFRIEVQGKAKSTYMANPHGMLQYVYECSTWTAIKL